ncbi:MAG: hypothetical protein QOF06_1915 [Solirubrobacterales bacterium]|jgi:predicted RNA-binding Zn-ribbon protein involved in translation (DUF1610 family)|nr:hypothetical protein [Solirubrobacterales bacterium]
MDQVESPHTVVPLEAGAGPENPPCPACGEPLFGWIAQKRGLAGPVRRCESCGLAVVGDAAGAEEALHELDRLRDGETIRVENRASFACSLGGAGWAGLQPQARHLFTVEAIRRLIARRDQVVKSSRWRPGASLAATWQTLLNSVTFGHNIALGALRGVPSRPASKPWQRRIDALASVVLAIPALFVAIPVELAGGSSRRGAVISVRVELF